MQHPMPSPRENEIHLYTTGRCHVFAVAMHRLYGATLTAVTIPGQPVWIADGDFDNFIPSVLHVFAILNGMAHDIETVIPESDIIAYCERRFDIDEDLQEEMFGSESELSVYVRSSGSDNEESEAEEGDDEDENPVLPLSSYTEADIEEAMDVARRLYGGRCPEKIHMEQSAS